MIMATQRFISFKHNGASAYGIDTGNGIINLSKNVGTTWPDLMSVLKANAFAELSKLASTLQPDIAANEIVYDIPLATPEKIICVGVNFPDRNEEYKDGNAAPPNPSLFIRFPNSFTGHNQPLIRPPESRQLDYEGEIAIIIGKGGRRISEAHSLSHIAALTLCNEGTLRDWVRHAKFNVTQGKNFDRSGAIGPWIIPYTDENQLKDIQLTTRVNGEIRQQDRTSRMIFSFRKIIAYISTFATLAPGDIIVCGTPTGAGARFDPPIWLKPGDVVEVEADGIGILRNTVADEVV
jgi:2-keto-4-pentenoate hydratase/2-oxohepta-3-ene-1,7-dioic acid hydratase in catechol pathway